MGWEEFQGFNRQFKSQIPGSPSEWVIAFRCWWRCNGPFSHPCELSSLSAGNLLSKRMIHFSDSQSRGQTFLSATPGEASSPPLSFSCSCPQNSFSLLHCHLSWRKMSFMRYHIERYSSKIKRRYEGYLLWIVTGWFLSHFCINKWVPCS